jgi:hypothetical protein
METYQDITLNLFRLRVVLHVLRLSMTTYPWFETARISLPPISRSRRPNDEGYDEAGAYRDPTPNLLATE